MEEYSVLMICFANQIKKLTLHYKEHSCLACISKKKLNN